MVRSSVLVLVGAAVLMVVSALVMAHGARAGAPRRADQLRFMWAMAQQESGGDYYARNGSSGAFGKYQIMPFNWPDWADEFIGDSQADQSPYNQEQVAYAKIRALYRWLGSWKRVAYWWLTGRTDSNPKHWSDYARGYVDNIMALRRRAPKNVVPSPEQGDHYAKKGAWRRSSSSQKLRLRANGDKWPERGRINSGQVVRVHSTAVRKGIRWLRVVTADGRLGWVKQQSTVPSQRPKSPHRFADVTDQGGTQQRSDRLLVRPRPS